MLIGGADKHACHWATHGLWRGCEQPHGRGGNLIGCSGWGGGGVGVWWGCGAGCGGGGVVGVVWALHVH